jgi:hypothetical protein
VILNLRRNDLPFYGYVWGLLSLKNTRKSFPCIHLLGEEENCQIHEINLVVKQKVADLGDRLDLRTQKESWLKHLEINGSDTESEEECIL